MHHVKVCDHGALGLTSGARGVQNDRRRLLDFIKFFDVVVRFISADCQVVPLREVTGLRGSKPIGAAAKHLEQRRAVDKCHRQQVRQVRLDNHRTRGALVHDKRNAFGRVARADRNGHGPALGNGIKRQHELGPVGHQQGHPVPPHHAQALQSRGNAPAGVFQLGPGPALRAVYQCFELRMPVCSFAQQAGDAGRARCEAAYKARIKMRFASQDLARRQTPVG